MYAGWGSTFGTTKCRTADISEFRNFEISNIKITKVELFDFSIFEFVFYFYVFFFFNSTNTQNTYMYI